jgi:ADP-ribosyl-[dinitrogen reductase] hydrolase
MLIAYEEPGADTIRAPEAVNACVAYAELISDAIAGMPAHEALGARSSDYAGGIGAIMAGGWRGKPRYEIASSGYVAHSLEAALWSVARTSDFRSAILLAANLGGGADTTSTIAGQLTGPLYGASGIPDEWLARLAWKPRIEGMAFSLLECPERPGGPSF